jgi:hypothetical protein
MALQSARSHRSPERTESPAATIRERTEATGVVLRGGLGHNRHLWAGQTARTITFTLSPADPSGGFQGLSYRDSYGVSPGPMIGISRSLVGEGSPY